jgi:hypothetical protein
MRRPVALAAAVALLCPATAAGATKNGIKPLAPKRGSTVAAGESPTFRLRVKGPGSVWIHVCRSRRQRSDGTICSRESIGQAKRVGKQLRYTPPFFDYEDFWLNRPGVYFWQAHRIDCSGGTKDCRQEGPIVRFSVA